MVDYKQDLFLIGIGGTGMRCLESFIHLCAMGMMDGKEIHLLALDTDRDNGNFDRLIKLVGHYNNAKGYNKTKQVKKETFFSAKVNFYKFSPDYSTQENNSFVRIMNMVNATKEQKDLADLLFSKNVQNFNLQYGYRAQTHLGSMLMYQALIDEVVQNPDSPLWEFVQQLVQSEERADITQLFVMGSVFGGTGASSIPVIPKAINKILELRSNKKLSKVFFGASLLTHYFTFREPDDEERKHEKVIASANSFALNSQAALMFYEEDKTVKQTYQKFYILGTKDPTFQTFQQAQNTITGGITQRNDAHYLELFAAFAALDFFSIHESILEDLNESGAKYFYRTIDYNHQLDFKDFSDAGLVDEFKKRITCFTALSFIANLEITDFYNQARSGKLKDDNIEGFEMIHPEEVTAIKNYFDYYHFRIVSNDQVADGWLRQLHRSIGGGDRMLFTPEIFGTSTKKELETAPYYRLFSNPNYHQHNFNAGGFMDYFYSASRIAANAFDSFKTTFINQENTQDENRIEILTKRIYDTLIQLYNFK